MVPPAAGETAASVEVTASDQPVLVQARALAPVGA
jgi:hypothetical protein